MVTTGKRCKATTKAGNQCQAYALAESDYCFHHDPTKAAERKAARAKGGRARHGRRIDQGSTEPVRVESMADVIRLLERAVNDALALENSLQRARTLGYLAGAMIKALEVGDLEERVSALEARQHE